MPSVHANVVYFQINNSGFEILSTDQLKHFVVENLF